MYYIHILLLFTKYLYFDLPRKSILWPLLFTHNWLYIWNCGYNSQNKNLTLDIGERYIQKNFLTLLQILCFKRIPTYDLDFIDTYRFYQSSIGAYYTLCVEFILVNKYNHRGSPCFRQQMLTTNIYGNTTVCPRNLVHFQIVTSYIEIKTS